MPAILEYLPYRKGDVTSTDDAVRHPWFAGHGYAAVRVDIRGSGDSEGVLLDEYHPQEQLDCLEVLRWLAAQPWCTGDVGMMGISWGGFNSLQVAAHRPPELKAIITCCSTDDRYADDVHYIGGLPLAFYLLPWASVMLTYNARPPDPLVVGEDRWRELWLQRLDGSPFPAETWLAHQRRDAYWQQGSVCEDYGAIEAAVYAVGGWNDGYTSAILRLLDGLECPRKALIGPWEHMWPEEGIPGPRIGFLQEALRFWDHWLKGRRHRRHGRPDAALLAAGLGAAARCVRGAGGALGGGGRVAVGAHRAAGGLPHARRAWRPTPATATTLAHSSPLTLGADAGSWLPYGNPADLPADQRAEDAWSLCFDGPPLDAPLDVLGIPRLRLRIAADRPAAFVVARLCDVAPDGTSCLVTRGVLNLCHRHGHDRPEPLVPGEVVDVELPLKAIGYAVPAGHRLRLALSTSYWPWVWPSPEPVEVAVTCDGGSCLELPVRPPRPADAELEPFDEPEISAPLAGRVAGGAQPALGDRARRGLGLAHRRHVARAVRRQAVPERHRVPRPRSGALRHPRGRPAVGDRGVRADDPHRPGRRLADAHRDAGADVVGPRGLPRLGDARRLRGRPPGALARPLLALPARPLLRPWTRAATRRRWRRGSTRSSR